MPEGRLVKTFLKLCCILGLLALAKGAWGDGAIRDGIGARSAGRGGTNLAWSDNGAVIHDNPAGIANIDGGGLIDIGGDVIITDLRYSDPDNDVQARNNPFPMAQVSIVERRGDWAYGLGVFAPAGFSAQYDMVGPAPFGGDRNYKSIGSLARVLPGVAYHATDRLAVGGTLGVAVSHVELEGPYFLQAAPLGGTPTMLDLQSTGAALSWSLGMQYQLTEQTTIGLAYQGETPMRLDGNSRVETIALGESYYDTDFYLTWPQSLGLGIKHEFCAHRIFSLDLYWYDWSGAFDEFGVNLSDAEDPMYALLFPTIEERVPLNWRDTVSVRMGWQQYLTDTQSLRFGYAYHRNPIPNGTLTPFIQTTLEHALSVGYGFVAPSEIEIDLAYQFNFDRPRDVAASNFIGGDFDNSRLHTMAHWVYLSLLKRY